MLCPHGKLQFWAPSSAKNTSSTMGQHVTLAFMYWAEKKQLEKWLNWGSRSIVSAHTVSWWLFRKKQVVTSQLPCFPRRAQGTEKRKTPSLLWIQLSQTSLFPPAWVAFAVFVACTMSWETPSSAQEASDPGPTWTAQQHRNQLWLESMSTLNLGHWNHGSFSR